jgi:chaperonin GroES
MKIRPLNDRVLIRRVEGKEQVKGGIIIPDTAKEKPYEGEVVAVGEGKLDDSGKRVAPQVKKGDRVLFAKYAGSELPFKMDDNDYIILREDDILGIIG